MNRVLGICVDFIHGLLRALDFQSNMDFNIKGMTECKPVSSLTCLFHMETEVGLSGLILFVRSCGYETFPLTRGGFLTHLFTSRPSGGAFGQLEK